ncbi:hypothetical protein [Gordonia alkaliphila]|uniref:RES domain-containing protein n=1 Tax=Gordonia alkaliphila TaxID=1053547 RepID=A0ABP8Z4K8_9ACTN
MKQTRSAATDADDEEIEMNQLTGPEILELKRQAFVARGLHGTATLDRAHPAGEAPPWAFTSAGAPWAEAWYVPGGWTRITPSGPSPDDRGCAEQVAWYALHKMYTLAATPDPAARLALGNRGPRLCTPPNAPRQLLRACDHTRSACWSDRARAEGDRQIVYSADEEDVSIVLAWEGFERNDDGTFKPAGVSRSCTTTRDADITAWADAAAAWLLHGAVAQ